MTCERPYCQARTPVEACLELRKEARSQFDPNLVEVFVELVECGAVDALGKAGPLSESPFTLADTNAAVAHNQGAA